MASALGRVLTIGALVLGLPAACLGTLLAYGKALSEAEVAEGILLTPEEARARSEELARRFAAMTDAQHLAAAREAMARGFDPARRVGGGLDGAEAHLRAIAEAAPEHAEVAPLREEIARRRAAMHALMLRRRDAMIARANGKLTELLRDADDAARDDDWGRRARRIALARALDELSAPGLGCVHTERPWAVALRFDHGRCDRAMLDRLARPEHVTGLRALGFQAVICGNGRGAIELAAAPAR